MTAETMKCRRRATTRWWKITDIALSSTLKANELKNSMLASRTQPMTARWARKLASSATMARDCPGTIHSR